MAGARRYPMPLGLPSGGASLPQGAPHARCPRRAAPRSRRIRCGGAAAALRDPPGRGGGWWVHPEAAGAPVPPIPCRAAPSEACLLCSLPWQLCSTAHPVEAAEGLLLARQSGLSSCWLFAGFIVAADISTEDSSGPLKKRE